MVKICAKAMQELVSSLAIFFSWLTLYQENCTRGGDALKVLFNVSKGELWQSVLLIGDVHRIVMFDF